MQPDFWRDRWRAGQIGFHQPDVNRHLKRFWSQVCPSAGQQVFVPLCGKSVDLLWLSDLGNRVSGVELSEIAVETFHLENGVAARRCRRAGFDVFVSRGLTVYCGNLHALRVNTLGRVDAVYDRGALTALPQSSRRAYSQHMASLTAPGVNTLLIVMEYPEGEIHGPPFAVTTKEVTELYGASHRIELLVREDILAEEPRMRARGATELFEACYHLTQL